MSRIVQKLLRWTPSASADTVAYEVYAATGAAGDSLAADADAGNIAPVATVAAPDAQWPITGLSEDLWTFAVIAVDDAGNRSDPLSPAVWQDVPLDVSPPEAPTGGEIVTV